MSFKAFIKNLLAFLKELFGDKKETVQPSTTTPTIVRDPSKELSEETIYTIVGGHSFEEQGKIRKYIASQEAKGICPYTFETSRFKVTVKVGTPEYGAQYHFGKKEMKGTSY